jgi:hypothetical protein
MLTKLVEHETLTSELVADVLHPDFGTSCLVVIPPCFGATELASLIAHGIAAHPSSPPVASISPDAVPDGEGYVATLIAQWGERAVIPRRETTESLEMFVRRVMAVGTSQRPLVQVVERFHKILDCIDPWLLGLMRTEEQSRRLRSIVLCPYPYDEIKRRWERIGVKLTVSNYGDKHVIRRVQMPSPDMVRTRLLPFGIPDHILQHLMVVSGAYPEILASLLEFWVREGRPEQLTNKLRLAVREHAVSHAAGVIRILDVPGSTFYLERLIDLHFGIGREAQQYLSQHPWAPFLLDADGNLRSECLGLAALRFWLGGMNSQWPGRSLPVLSHRARELYESGQYGAAAQSVDSISGEIPASLEVLTLHSKIMTALFGQSGEETAGENTEWPAVLEGIRAARRRLDRDDIDAGWRGIAESRWGELETVATKVCEVRHWGQARVVDALAGMISGHWTTSNWTALLLIILSVESGRAIRGNVSAIRAVLPIPEQIYRLWAFWRFRLNYYEAPNLSHVWDIVVAAWPYEKPAQPKEGGSFQSFELFAYVGMALHLQSGSGSAPEVDWQNLRKALSHLEIRRDAAHAIVLSDSRRRQRYFELVDRWVEVLFQACPETVVRDELLAVIDPLPLLDPDYPAPQ